MSTAKVIYIRDKNTPKGGVTIAYNVLEKVHDINDEQGKPSLISFKYAIARCSKKDNFIKKYGRAKALGRLNSPDFCNYIYLKFEIDFITYLFTKYFKK